MTGPSNSSFNWAAYARDVVEHAVRHQPESTIPTPEDSATEKHAGVFVTLHKLGQLRGCMGTLDSALPLPTAVRQAAVTAATRDPRFPPVAPDELPDIDLEVSIMEAPHPMRSLDDLELGRHGIIVQSGRRRGLFLPQVATQHHMDKETFLTRCCADKAGLPPDAWRDPQVEVLLFESHIYHEQRN